MDNGWIKLHRKFLEWAWFDKSEMVHLFIFLLLDANHADKDWRGIIVKRGQLVTSLASISVKTHLSIQRVRTCLNRLKSTHEITSKSTREYTVITILNYESYQQKEIEINKSENKAANKRSTNNQQTINKRSTTNKNEKNEKNERSNTATSKISVESLVLEYKVNQDFGKIIYDWFEYKKERKEAYKSERSIKAFITKLKNLSDSDPNVAKQIIDQSLANNYAGIFELKTNKKNETDSRIDAARRKQQIMELAREADMA